MNKPEFKLLPCLICTIGYNCYVASHKVTAATFEKMTSQKQAKRRSHTTSAK